MITNAIVIEKGEFLASRSYYGRTIMLYRYTSKYYEARYDLHDNSVNEILEIDWVNASKKFSSKELMLSLN